MAQTHNNLKAECARLGITLRQLCREADVPEATVSAWKRKEPGSIESLRKLEAAIERIYNKQFEEAQPNG